VSPALHFGGRGILVPTEHTPESEVDEARRHGLPIVATLLEAVHLILHA
jgi:hypothetical protein